MNYACSIGFFDGVHRGHQYLLRQLREVAAARGLVPMVCTFAQHPAQVLRRGDAPHLLTSLDEKREYLREMGIAECLVLDFTPELARLTAREFMREVLLPRGVRLLLMGYDHRFGSDRADYAACRILGEELGMEVCLEKPFSEDACTFSSSLIRKSLASGDVKSAAAMLGRHYALEGEVVEGRHVGTTMGFPTANLRLSEPRKQIPACGAYAVWACLGSKRYAAMTNIGTRPTLQNGNDVSIETHLFNYASDLYGKPLRLEFVERLREEVPFASLEALKQQLAEDAARTNGLLIKN